MRILLLSHGYHPTVSGVTHVVRKQARALVNAGHDVAVVTGSDRGNPYLSDDGGIHLVRIRTIRNPFWSEGPLPWLSRRGLKALIDQYQPDVIHSHENALMSIQLTRIRNSLSQPLIVSCYSLPEFGAHYLPQYLGVGKGICKTLWRYLIWNLNQYDTVILATQSHKRICANHGLKAPTTIISNGVDLSRYAPQNGQVSDVTRRYKLPERPRILFVGRLARDKYIDILIQAMKTIREACPAHLLIVGRGDDYGRLRKVVADEGLEENVHFLGFVPEEDLPSIYRHADLFAMVSICETQNIPTLQALASGLPAVVTKAGALPELVHHGVNGYLVSPGDPRAISDACQKILTNRQSAHRFGLASLEVGRSHAERKSFIALEALYESALENQGQQVRQPITTS